MSPCFKPDSKWDAEKIVKRYLLRHCLSLHECALCGRPILLGQHYYDGGYGRRYHAGHAEFYNYQSDEVTEHLVNTKDAFITPKEF